MKTQSSVYEDSTADGRDIVSQYLLQGVASQNDESSRFAHEDKPRARSATANAAALPCTFVQLIDTILLDQSECAR
jgi:hypothetical protein